MNYFCDVIGIGSMYVHNHLDWFGYVGIIGGSGVLYLLLYFDYFLEYGVRFLEKSSWIIREWKHKNRQA